MVCVTYYVVLAFDETSRGRFTAREPLAPQNPEAAKRAAVRLKGSAAGVVAFSRTGNPDLGDWADAVVLARYGDLPEDLGLPDVEVWDEALENTG